MDAIYPSDVYFNQATGGWGLERRLVCELHVNYLPRHSAKGRRRTARCETSSAEGRAYGDESSNLDAIVLSYLDWLAVFMHKSLP
ncbi:hypothetical protein EVAR_86165_1 [Eumeta japonica]|uniref:Uncharacterized protein n=1 Tax=Eumeta variegata TaxID=151549 RepID=A0A4C1Z373_EUMVA|nr:hypothetical protein EVAR_86165_1 [Eumeta japonica]